MDLATRQVTRLESTTTNALIPCTTAASEGFNDSLRWSPDGSRLLVVRQGVGPPDEGGPICRSVVFTVNADGTGFRMVVPSDGQHEPNIASWSPDGSHIAFHMSNYSASAGPEPLCDVNIVRPDGSELRELTSDGVSCWPRWTRDGHIVFLKWTNPEHSAYDLWIMDGDGSNPMRLDDTSIPALSAIGCMVCPSPENAEGGDVLWQPTR
jgi:Tol biopolymer transport system component